MTAELAMIIESLIRRSFHDDGFTLFFPHQFVTAESDAERVMDALYELCRQGRLDAWAEIHSPAGRHRWSGPAEEVWEEANRLMPGVDPDDVPVAFQFRITPEWKQVLEAEHGKDDPKARHGRRG